MKNSGFKLFLLDGCDKSVHREKRDPLIRQAALFYGAPKESLSGEKIVRTEKGKPFFEKLDIHFSISHSEALWACLMGPFNCGLDVQYVKPCNFKKIAGRFFSERENDYVERGGLEAFFDIWVRREAFGKYTGEGFFGYMPELVSEDGELSGRAYGDGNGGNVRFIQFDLGRDIKCAACFPDGDPAFFSDGSAPCGPAAEIVRQWWKG